MLHPHVYVAGIHELKVLYHFKKFKLEIEFFLRIGVGRSQSGRGVVDWGRSN